MNYSHGYRKKIGAGIGIALMLVGMQSSPLWAEDDSGSSDAINNAQFGDWPLYSYNYANTNANLDESKLNPITAKHLKRAWETFNDDALVPEPAPTGFVFESVLDLTYPNSVVGVVASPVIVGGTIYYVDQLGTVFARDAKTGQVTDSSKHWTTTLVDPDFVPENSPILPELIYTAPVVTKTHIWIAGSVYGRLHAIELATGNEVDFDTSSTVVDPYVLVPDLLFPSVLGDSVAVQVGEGENLRDIFITGVNVIVNDAAVQGGAAGIQVALDITDPENPVEIWRTSTIDINPATGLRYGTGASAGSGIAVDQERGLIFAGTGQNTSEPYPGYPDPNLAPAGYIDRSDAIYAIDYLTGEFAWFNQFHGGDVFDINNPTSTGPGTETDADVLSPPVLWSAEVDGEDRDLAGVGSKGGLYRVVDRDNGDTVWERQISKQTGIGGIQAGSAYYDDVVYVVGFEGIDDGFSDAQFGYSFDTGNFPNAFFATFGKSFWADVEDTAPDGEAGTGMRMKVYALDAATGQSVWDIDGLDYVELLGGAALRHLSVANGMIFVTSSSGTLYVLDPEGNVVFTDQTVDLNEFYSLDLGKPHHAAMNGGAIVSNGQVFVPYGGQNHPAGGMLAYEIDVIPASLELISILKLDVRSLYANQSVKKPLKALLRKAKKDLKKGKIRKAKSALYRFITKVNRAADKNRISYYEAHGLNTKAFEIINLLSD